MGFKTTNYELKDCGLTLDTAYAQISSVSIGIDGNATAVFDIQKDRSSIASKRALDTVFYSCTIDKDLPIHKQVYEKAKVDVFADWNDDIV